MPHVKLDDVEIYYEVHGDRPATYVFCHGLGGSGSSFNSELDFWTQHFRVITWDNRGLGRSSPAAKYSAPLYAQDLNGLLAHLGIEQALIHGVSWGGVLVQQFALDYPERCAALVIDSSSSEVNVEASEGWYARGEGARLAHKTGEPSSVRPEHLDSYVAQARAVAGLREHPYTPRLKQITCPALVVGGGQDATAGAGGSVILSRVLPNAELKIWQDGTHGLFRSKRDEFRELVLEFARRHGILT
ncbi:MAG TPA: alpha/beta hydrolase [Dehalococcoidia bacterium]|jgi:pimeloyl-ACP methyl ester carboxylesterase|nr:alpha/beta hydrolase [Dehalococcoidia bacterium]